MLITTTFNDEKLWEHLTHDTSGIYFTGRSINEMDFYHEVLTNDRILITDKFNIFNYKLKYSINGFQNKIRGRKDVKVVINLLNDVDEVIDILKELDKCFKINTYKIILPSRYTYHVGKNNYLFDFAYNNDADIFLIDNPIMPIDALENDFICNSDMDLLYTNYLCNKL